MSELIQIRFLNKENDTEHIRALITDFFTTKIVDWAIKSDFWDTEIKAIVITDDFKNEIDKQANIWNIQTHLSQEKEYRVSSKILFNNNLESPEYHIFFDYQCLLSENYPILQTPFSQILNVFSKKIIPLEVRKYQINPSLFSLNDYIKLASVEWCKAVYISFILSKIQIEKTFLINHNSCLIAFKRELKKNLYEYNSDKEDNESRLQKFWNNYFDSLRTLFLRIAQNDTDKTELLIKENEPCRSLIYSVINEIRKLTNKCLDNQEYEVNNLKETIKKFSAHFEIFLENETEQGFKIRLTKDPKDYFIDEIVETEPRIVCFMDILGFSNMIEQYDKNITSTVLQDIQEAFALAKINLLENKNLLNKNNNATKHLKYQTFSDNICISIPYFDNENDFLSNFNILITYVRGVQSILMTKGFYTRGGVSIGSYYTDNNIIFSKGLVNAYNLESKKAIYPRVIIDNSIIEKLRNYNREQIKSFGIDGVIIFDWENTAFLNPFGLTKSINETSVELLKSLLDNEKKSIQLVKEQIVNIYLHYKDENIRSKYLWLLEFIKWIENDETAQLKFQYMSEKLNQTQNK